MNKIYRTVYNETTGTWVAVCETAKTHTKSSGKSAVVKAMAAAGLVAVAGVAGAVPVITGANPDCDSEDSIVCIGNQVKAKQQGVTVIGYQAQTNNRTVKQGENSKTSQGGETVVGSEAQADGNGAVSIGGKGGLPFKGDPSTGTITYGKGTVAVGRNARAMATVLERGTDGKINFNKLLNDTNGSVLTGTNAKEKSIVVSDDYTATSGTRISNDINQGQNIAIGDNSQAFSHQSLAVGGNTMALGVASIAIGGDDVGNGDGKYTETTEVIGQNANGSDIEVIKTVSVTGESDAGFRQSLNTIAQIKKGLSEIGAEFKLQAAASDVTLSHDDYIPDSITNILGNNAYKDTTMASGDIAMALGTKAVASGNLSDAIGMNAVASGESSLSVGTVSRAEGQYANAVGTGATAKGTRTNAFGTGATAVGDYANAVGTSQAEGAYSSAMGYLNESLGENSVAVGTKNVSQERNTVAMGVDNEALGQESIAIGTNNKSTGYQSLAYGQGNTTSNTQSITFGTGNKVTSMNSGSFGSGNTVDSGNASNGSYVIGNSNNVTTANTFVLGSNVGNTNLGGDATLANSVYLGAGSTTATTKGGAGLTDVNDASVKGITYSGFAGKKAQGIVSVGTDSSARRIQNVAAGAINADSTDAINGSQLFAVLPQYETDPTTNNVTSVKVGNQTYNFAAADGNDITELTVNNYQAAGSTTGNLKLTDQGSGNSHKYNVALNNTVELGDNTADGSLTVGNQAGDSKTEIKPNNINFTNADGGSITNVASHLKDPASQDDKGQVINPDNTPDKFNNVKNEAATVGDVLNAGWNLQVADDNGNLQAADFVQHGDTVKFGNSDTVNAKYDGGVIKFSVNTTTPDPVITDPANPNVGKVVIKSGDENKIVTADDLATAINSSGWVASDSTKNAFVATGDKVTIVGAGGTTVELNDQNKTFTVKSVEISKYDGTPNTQNADATVTEITDADGNKYKIGGGSSGDENWNLTVDGDDTNATSPNAQRNLKDSNTVNVTQNGNNITFDVITTPLSVVDSGDKAGSVNTVKSGDANKLVTAGDVANVVNNTYWTASDGSNTTPVKASDTVTFKGADNGNVSVTNNGGVFEFKVNTAGKAPTVKDITSQVGGADGDILTAKQITQTINQVAENWKWNIQGQDDGVNQNGGNAAEVKYNQTVNINAGKGLSLEQNGTTLNLETNYVFKNGDADITNTGGNVTKIETTDDSGNTIAYNITGSGSGENNWNLTVGGDNTTVTQAGDTRNLTNTDGNIAIAFDKTGGKDISFDLSNKITVGDTVSGSPVVIDGSANGGSITFTDNKGNVSNQGVIDGVASHLQDPASKDGEGKEINSANAPTNFDSVKNEAATVGDVLNAGWNLQVADDNGNLQAADFVQHGDTVKFGDSDTVNAQYDSTNGVIKFSVNTTKPDPVIADPANPNVGKVVIKSGDENKIVTAGDLATAINSSGWVASDSTNNAFVATGDTVTIKGQNGVKVGLDAKNQTFTVDSDYVFKDSNDDIITNKGGDVAKIETKDDKGNTIAYNITGSGGDKNWNLTVDGEDPSKGTAPGATVQRNLKNGDGNIDIQQDNAGNIYFDLEQSITVGHPLNGAPVTIDGNNGEIRFADNGGVIKFKGDNGIISGVKSHFADVVGGKEIPNTNLPSNWTSKKNEAATLGDVMNAGYGLKANGNAVDFVAHGDTVNFTSNNNSITITPTTDNTNSILDLSANVVFYSDDTGNTVATGTNKAKSVKVGDTLYQLGGDDNSTHNYYGGDAVNVKGTGPVSVVKKNQTDPATGTDFIDYTVSVDTTTPTVNTDLAQPNVGKVVINSGNENKLVNAGDMANAINQAGWVASDGTNKTLVQAGNTATIKGENGVKVALDDTTQTFTVKGLTVSKSDPAATTGGNATATELTDADGNTYNIGTADGNDITSLTAQGEDANKTTGNLNLTDKGTGDSHQYDIALNNTVELGDNTTDGSLTVGNKAGDSKTEINPNNINFTNADGGSITNVASHLKDQKAGDTVMNTDNAPANFDSVKNEAATVGDVLNAGWNLKVGNADADFVQHGDTVAFGNGKGTTAQYDATNGVVSFDITKANNPTVPTTGNNAGTVTGGTANQYWDSVQVQTAINNAGWFATAGATGSGTVSGKVQPQLVTAGNEVKFTAGDGMEIEQKGSEFIFKVAGGGSGTGTGTGTGGGWTVVDPNNPQDIKINGGGQNVEFVGDVNTSVNVKRPDPSKQNDPVGIQVGLNDKVYVGGTSDGTATGTPNAGSVTIDGSNPNGAGAITFNNQNPDNSVTVNGDSGSLNLGKGSNNNPVNITNVAAGNNGTNDAVNVAQIEDVVGAANKDANGVVKTTGTNGEEYTLKTYNVNGQGEYLTNNVIEAVSKMNEQGIKFVHVNDGTQTPVAQNTNSVDSQAFGKNSIAIGVKSTANGNNAIVIGTENTVNGNNSGAIGDPTIIDGSNSYSVGNNNTVATDDTFVLGNDVGNTLKGGDATLANSVYLGSGATTKTTGTRDATKSVNSATVNGITYDGFKGDTPVGIVSVGSDTAARRIQNVAAGEISKDSTDAINGSQLYAVLPQYTVGSNGKVDNVTVGDKTYDFANYDFKGADGVNVNVDGATNTVTISGTPGYASGIKAGENVVFNYEDNTDAAGNPLYVTTTGGTTTDVNDPNVKRDANGDPVKQQTTVINAKQPDLRPIEQHVQQVENNAYAGVAQAMATAGLPQAYLPGKSMVAIAGGHYKGEQGYALGLSSISDSGNWVFKATASGNSRGNVGGTIGAGYQW